MNRRLRKVQVSFIFHFIFLENDWAQSVQSYLTRQVYVIIRPVGAGGAMAPPDLGRSVNPISARGGRLRPPNYNQHPQIFRHSYGKFFTYVTKTRPNLRTYSRKPGNYNDTIIFEIGIMKKSSPLNLKFTFFATVKTKITLLLSVTHFILSRKKS